MAALIAFVVGGIALCAGIIVCIALSGFGICEISLTWKASVIGIVIAIVVSLIGFVAVPAKRALGAGLFSLPLGFAVVLFAIDREWWRSAAMLICIITASVTVWALGKKIRTNGPNQPSATP